MRLACHGNVAYTSAVLGFKRMHDTNRTHDYLANRTTDLVERLAAIESFAANDVSDPVEAARLLRLGRRSLAERAYWCGVKDLVRGRRSHQELFRLAFRLDPATRLLPPMAICPGWTAASARSSPAFFRPWGGGDQAMRRPSTDTYPGRSRARHLIRTPEGLVAACLLPLDVDLRSREQPPCIRSVACGRLLELFRKSSMRSRAAACRRRTRCRNNVRAEAAIDIARMAVIDSERGYACFGCPAGLQITEVAAPEGPATRDRLSYWPMNSSGPRRRMCTRFGSGRAMMPLVIDWVKLRHTVSDDRQR